MRSISKPEHGASLTDGGLPTLLSIIERLEKCTGRDREIDQAIYDALGMRSVMLREYTALMDDAMTLVPLGAWNGRIEWNFGDTHRGGFVDLNLANPAWLKPDWDPSLPPHAHAACVSSYEDYDERHEPPAPRPFAIALCIAALKARHLAASEIQKPRADLNAKSQTEIQKPTANEGR